MKVYISHSEADEKIARSIAERLTSEGFVVTYPREDLYPGDNWALESGKALQESDAMVVLLSPAAAKSEWLRREISFAVGNSKYAWRLIPVNLRPARKIPWVLTNIPPIPWSDDMDLTVKKIADRIQRPIQRFKHTQAARAV